MRHQRLLTAAGLALGSSLLVSWALAPTTPAAPVAEVEATGIIDAWSLDEDARLYLRIQPDDSSDKRAPVWFVTGEGQADRAQFRGSIEGLIQADIAGGGGLKLTVRGEGSRKLDGESKDKAVKITGVGQG